MNEKYKKMSVFMMDSYPKLTEDRKCLTDRIYGWQNDKSMDEAKELRYLDWKADLIQRVVKERLGDMERPIFRLIYGKRMTFREVREVYHRNTGMSLTNAEIVKVKKQILENFMKELLFSDTYDDEREYMDQLIAETEEWLLIPGNAKKIPKS